MWLQVFRVLSPEGEVLALKQVRLDAEPSEADALLQAVQNEIELMRTANCSAAHVPRPGQTGKSQ